MNAIATPIRFVAVDLLWSIVYFPLWWYSRGLGLTTRFIFRKLKETERALAIGIILRYFFKPMYADYTKTGRAISLVFRLLHLSIMLIIMFVVSVIYLVLFLLYLVWLPAAAYFFIFNLTG